MLNKLYFGITLTWRKIKWDSLTDFKAFLLFYFSIVINIVDFLMFISIISQIPPHEKMNTLLPKEIHYLIIIGFFITLYFGFYKRREKIFIKYENMPQHKMFIIQLLTWIYVITTFILFYYIGDEYR